MKYQVLVSKTKHEVCKVNIKPRLMSRHEDRGLKVNHKDETVEVNEKTKSAYFRTVLTLNFLHYLSFHVHSVLRKLLKKSKCWNRRDAL